MSHEISLSSAIKLTSEYRDNRSSLTGSTYPANALALSETFNREAFDTLLAQTNCTSIRIYYGMDTEQLVHAVVVGVDEDGKDMIPGATNEGVIIEMATRCPDLCPKASPLNS